MGNIPVTIALLKKLIDSVKGSLRGQSGSSAHCDDIVVDTFRLSDYQHQLRL
jgi:hypothetical protein